VLIVEVIELIEAIEENSFQVIEVERDEVQAMSCGVVDMVTKETPLVPFRLDPPVRHLGA